MTIEVAGFEIEGELGRGGFGVVYKARQLAFNRHAAIKVLLPGMSADEIARRFAQECRALGALRPHPNVLTVYSTGTTAAGAPYLAMQYLPGGSLSERTPLDPDAVAALGIRLADGLAVAHAGGVVHRDVKPANILFDHDDEPVLVDFGISSLAGEASTTSDEVAVSIGYTPPEILNGAKPTASADVYALGATLFAAVSGRTPFVTPDGFSSIGVMAARILNMPVEDLRAEGVPDALCTVIETCMAKDPADRYASMSEVRAALLPLADESTVRTPSDLWGPPPVVDVLPDDETAPRRTFVSRLVLARRRAALTAAAAVVLIGGGIASAAVFTGDDRTPSAAPAQPISTPSATADATAGAPTGSSTASPAPGRSVTNATRPPAGAITISNGAAPPVVVGNPAVIGSNPIPVYVPPRTKNTVVTTKGGSETAVAHAPVLGSLQSFSASEQSAVSLALSARDADGGPLSYRVSGLPGGLHATSSGRISGTVAWDAVTATTSYRSIASRSFTVRVTVLDPTGRSDSGSFTVSVADIAFRMPDYYGKYGCNGQGNCRENVPNVAALTSNHPFSCSVNAAYADRIVAQSVSPGTIARWGARFAFTYGATSC